MITKLGLEKRQINESSYSRIMQHIEVNRPFAVISAFRGLNTSLGWKLDYPELNDMSKEEAEKRSDELDEEAHYKLKTELIKLYGFGVIEQGSGYENVDEKSFFIPGISYDVAFNISKRYKQQSMIWKDNTFFGMIYTNNFIDYKGISRKEHEKGIKFKSDIKNGVLTFKPEALKDAYSQLFKATKNQRRKYAFIPESVERYNIYERLIPGDVWQSMAMALKHEYRDIFTNEIIVIFEGNIIERYIVIDGKKEVIE